MKNQKFGVEIEITGITRKQAAEVLAKHFLCETWHAGGNYDTYEVKDATERIWKIVSDSSINPKRKVGNQILEAGSDYRAELVTPILKYEDIESLQEIVRKLRSEGAITNESCGIHIHIGAEKHNSKTLRNLINIMASKQDMIYKAFEVGSRRETNYCHKLGTNLITKLNKKKPTEMQTLADLWYDGYWGDRGAHYHDSRYHCLNLHSTFTKGTVEFRLFNGTLHAGKIKAYIQFCLAVNNQAITQKCASAKATQSDNEKYTFRTWLLRLGLIGEEFKTCREHLLAKLEGDIAWRHIAA